MGTADDDVTGLLKSCTCSPLSRHGRGLESGPAGDSQCTDETLTDRNCRSNRRCAMASRWRRKGMRTHTKKVSETHYKEGQNGCQLFETLHMAKCSTPCGTPQLIGCTPNPHQLQARAWHTLVRRSTRKPRRGNLGSDRVGAFALPCTDRSSPASLPS